MKTLKRKLILWGIAGGFLLLALGLFGTGLFAIYTMVNGLVEQLDDGGFYDGNYEHHLTMSDLSGYDIDKMIDVVSDPNVFDDEMLDAVFMERTTFLNLLNRVKEYNKTFDSADKVIGRMHYWYETVESEGPPDKEGNPTTVSTAVLRSAEEDYAYHVSAAPYEDHYYADILWQSLYVSAVADVLTSYQVPASSIQNGDSFVDNSREAEELIAYASSLLGSDAYTNFDYVRSVYDHFEFSIPDDAKTTADAFSDYVGSGICVSVDEVRDSLAAGDIVCFAAEGAIVTDRETSQRTYTGSGEDITLGIYAGDGTVLICENGKVRQKPLDSYRNRFYSARRTAMSEDAAKKTEVDGEEIVKGDGYASNKIGDYVGNWQPVNEYEAAQNQKYTPFIMKAAEIFNLPPDLVRANISAESAWNPRATNSKSTAKGLMQILDGTWDSYCVKCGYPAGDYSYKYDPEASIMVGAAVLNSYLYGGASGDVVDGLGMYHEGINGYKKKGGKNGGLCPTEVKKMSRFCNKQFTINDLQSGAYDSVADGYTGIGYISTNGRLILTDGQLDILMNTFKTYYTYTFDVVRDEQMRYSYSECEGLPNKGKKTAGSANDWYEWYEPLSQLDLAETPWMDVYYAYLNIESEKVIRDDRWAVNQMQIWETYEGSWYNALTGILPQGDEAEYRYQLYRGLSASVMEYQEGSDHVLYTGAGANTVGGGVVDGTTIDWASGGGYDLPDGYTSIQIPGSAGGMSIPLYLQYDSNWGSVRFGGGDIATSGCGATSMAMIITYLTKKQVTPDMVVAKIGNRYYVPGFGQGWGMPGGVAEIFGIKKLYEGTVNAEKILQYLKQGNPVLVSTTGKGTTREFTKNGHYIVLRGLDDRGRVLVNDPNDNTSSKQHYLKAYDVNFIVSECTENRRLPKHMWAFGK